MILDYNYSQKDSKFDISYINEDGQKSFLTFDNIKRFRTYYYTPEGQYETYNGAKCGVCYTDKPSKFDIKEFLTTLPEESKKIISQKTFPKMYAFDIEVKADEKGNYSTESEAANEITTISVASPDLDCVVFGTRKLSDEELSYCEHKFRTYIENNSFFLTLKKKTPKFKYLYCATERDMLESFLKRIVAKVSILSGWNCIKYDWQYITNRIKNYYPTLSIKLCSYTKELQYKNFKTKYGESFKVPMPLHTLILDMMDIISKDIVVMPIKESLGLDYIASESVGANKIKYQGTLTELYNKDYKEYVYYNSIDSVLVQLINYKFRCLDLYYLYSLYCTEKIGNCFSPIALTESLVFKDFYENNLKIVYEEKDVPERETLLGAYVKVPIPGRYKFICCNDFASLYPSTIITCNLSFENYIGAFYDEEILSKYRSSNQYVVVGPCVYLNENFGKKNQKPKMGNLVGKFLDEKTLDIYRKNKDYFVSVMGCVYKNDKEYTFKRIQRKLKANRDIDKYLGKKISAEVLMDISHVLKGANVELYEYDEEILNALSSCGYSNVSSGKSWIGKDKDYLEEAYRIIFAECQFYEAHQLAMKQLGNSMYGGCSHVAFYFYNMNLANDITGEARNIIHIMERHIPEWFEKEWKNMSDFHKKMNITLNEDKLKKTKNLCIPVYGDSCDESTVITLKDSEMTIKELFEENGAFIESRGKEFSYTDRKILNWNGKEFVYNNIKWVIRHKTEKNRWVVQVGENCVYVTEDHSLIIIDNGIKKISPRCVTPGMIMMTTDGPMEVTSCAIDGKFDTYVYDIEVDTEDNNMHNFFGNGILIHNTDSVKGDTTIQTDTGKKTIEQFFNENYDNGRFFSRDGHELVKTNAKVLNWNDELKYCGVNYIMRHKVKKAKWVLKTKSGKEITVTNDHSMIVFRDGKKLEVKPRDILVTDKILCIKE